MNGPLTFVTGSSDAGERLDVAVAAHAGTSRSAAARWIDGVQVTVDGAPARRSVVLAAGQHVVLPALPGSEPVPPPPLPPVRFRDEHLLVLSKPAGLVVHPGAGHHGDTLVDALRAAGVPLAPAGGDERPGIVHRLDRDTSGLLVVASTDAAHAGLVEQLRARSVQRRYLALVRGTPPPRGTVDAPIGRDPSDRQRFACVPGGKPARTHLTTIATRRLGDHDVAVLACRLETGRTHQIRVHLRAIGHPVLGDSRYGGDGAAAQLLDVPRVALHAARLAFTHPALGTPVDVVEPLPDDLRPALVEAGLDDSWQDALRAE